MNRDEGLAWQAGIWDGMSQVHRREIDPRLAPVVDHVLERADLKEGERVLDLGTGTGAVAEKAALAVGAKGHVLAVDPSPEMLVGGSPAVSSGAGPRRYPGKCRNCAVRVRLPEPGYGMGHPGRRYRGINAARAAWGGPASDPGGHVA